MGNVATSWNIEGAADFNGDGQADILWQNTSGARAIWLMNGTHFWQQHLPAIGGDLLEDRRSRAGAV